MHIEVSNLPKVMWLVGNRTGNQTQFNLNFSANMPMLLPLYNAVIQPEFLILDCGFFVSHLFEK